MSLQAYAGSIFGTMMLVPGDVGREMRVGCTLGEKTIVPCSAQGGGERRVNNAAWRRRAGAVQHTGGDGEGRDDGRKEEEGRPGEKAQHLGPVLEPQAGRRMPMAHAHTFRLVLLRHVERGKLGVADEPRIVNQRAVVGQVGLHKVAHGNRTVDSLVAQADDGLDEGHARLEAGQAAKHAADDENLGRAVHRLEDEVLGRLWAHGFAGKARETGRRDARAAAKGVREGGDGAKKGGIRQQHVRRHS